MPGRMAVKKTGPSFRGGFRIIDFFKEEGVARDGFSGGAAVARSEDLGHPFRPVPAPADFQQGPDDRPHHVPQETVRPDLEDEVIAFLRRIAEFRHMGRDIGAPGGESHIADRGLVRSSGLFEATEILPSDEVAAGLVHGGHVEDIAAAAGVPFGKGIPAPVDEIFVTALDRVEPGVEIRPFGRDAVYGDGAGQDGIYFVAESAGVEIRGTLEMGDVADRMDARIGPPRTCDDDFFLQEKAQRPLETFLDGGRVRLDLPAAERGPVIGQCDPVPHNECKNNKNMDINIKELNDRIQRESAFVDMLSLEMGKVIVGQKHLVENLLIGLLANGHILLEGVPGLAKTLAINTLAQAVDAKFSRIQFTPDLLPADVIGTMIYSQKNEGFEVHKGPVFANFVLADEINRSPAKVQSALLEAMQERQVTIGDKTFKLPEPFLVMATQNPIEQEGTYPLPEAQVDRFMLKVVVDYPAKEEERLIIRMNNSGEFPRAVPILKPEDIVRARSVVREVYMDEKIERYIVDLVYATRTPGDYGLGKMKDLVAYGASPRASISLAAAAKAYAFIKRRGYVIPEDVRAVSPEVLRHRIGLTYEAEAENVTTENIVSEVLNAVMVP